MLVLIHREALPMTANRETPVAIQSERSMIGLGCSAGVQCCFFLPGSQSLKRFLADAIYLNDSLLEFRRLTIQRSRPLTAGAAWGGAG